MSKYGIITYIGDYAVEKQPYWGQKHELIQAMAYAFETHLLFKARYFNLHYTVIMEEGKEPEVTVIIYKDEVIIDPKKATKLADSLGKEDE